MDRFMRRYRRIARRAQWVVLGGSVPPGVDEGIYHELTTLAKSAGARVVVTAGGEPLARALPACPYLVKPDIREHVSFEGASLATLDEILVAADPGGAIAGANVLQVP